MSTQSVIQALRSRHSSATTCEPGKCDACTVLELLEKHRDALLELQERNSKGQYDQAGFAATIQTGLGTAAR